MRMTSRPYFRHSIQELENEASQHKTNHLILSEVRAELDHRTTERARRLRVFLDAQLGIPPISYLPKPATDFSSHPVPPEQTYKSPGSFGHISQPEVVAGQSVPTASLPLTNKPEQLLDAWMALEVLSPATYSRPEELAAGDRRNVIDLSDHSLPWLQQRKSKPEKRMYYQVVLGSVRMEPAITRLLNKYGDLRHERPSARGRAALAVVILDSRGLLVSPPAVAVSSFGWGVMTALNGRLVDLARWPAVEPNLVDRLEAILNGPSGRNNGLHSKQTRSVSWSMLMNGYEMLVREFGLHAELVEPPTFAVCSYKYYRNPDPPEILLLNSFFMRDLSLSRKLVTLGQVPVSLDRYLGRPPPPARRDALNDVAILREAISPKMTPLVRWPGPARHPLCLMQQAAVNLATKVLAKDGILGVNGPPGTGKTTLLRDMVAHIVTTRAELMCRFDDPETAFVNSGERISAGASSWLQIFRLCPDLRGHEILVASSNNRAVENVSEEIPVLTAIADDATDLRYFQTLSNSLHERPTWGLIAAVLGNASNLYNFRNAFWWDEDSGMSAYLAAASGNHIPVQEQDPGTGETTFRKPKIVADEMPPTNHDEALSRWRKARDRFLKALERSREWQRKLCALEHDSRILPKLVENESLSFNRFTSWESAQTISHQNLVEAQKAVEDASKELGNVTAEINELQMTRPPWLSRLFGMGGAGRWVERDTRLRDSLKNCERILAVANSNLALRRLEEKQAITEMRLGRDEWEKATAARWEAENRINAARAKGVVFADEGFFQQPHTQKQCETPWFPPEAQLARDDLFQAAMHLHRAFIDAAAKPIRNNLGVLMNVMVGRRLRTPAQESLLGDLWSSLFLVVPLVSTTFASVERMLGRLPPESLGWLFIDEAGQALPQAAVGAILRTRRALVVGDPVQIEPVVVLPDQLTRAICVQMGVDPERYAAPSASVQTLADSASAYSSELQTRTGSRMVGIPLLVHRRCSQPMFGIANTVAYSGMMVSTKTPGPSPIREVLGPSAWLDVEGSSEDKWCPEEGEEVLDLLRRLATAGIKPDMYIVTPFVIVAERLRQLVYESDVSKEWGDPGGTKRWESERIGTVHTAQGREAEAVIFVLGAPNAANTGARSWAGGRPNLLNVALTRAKEVLYVVGNKNLWREAGFFRELAAQLSAFEEAEQRRELERLQSKRAGVSLPNAPPVRAND